MEDYRIPSNKVSEEGQEHSRLPLELCGVSFAKGLMCGDTSKTMAAAEVPQTPPGFKMITSCLA